jgi:uncharacterized LabA/DUF88 family protein
VTTQNTHHEHTDVDATVEQHPPAPEVTADSSASEATTPEATREQASASSSQPVASTEAPGEVISDPATTPVVERSVDFNNEEIQEPQKQEDQPTDVPVAQEGSALTTAEPVAEAVTETSVFSRALPLIEENDEEVRPFTSFIEEFRQAEALARLQVPLSETAAEPFSPLLPPVGDLAASPALDAAAEQLTTLKAAESIDTVESAESKSEMITEPPESAETAMTTEVPEGAETQVIPDFLAEGQGTAENQAEQTLATEEVKESTPLVEPVQETPPPLVERTVSPLLRPASPRGRVSRHSNRQYQHKEEAAAQTPEATPKAEEKTSEAQTAPLAEQSGTQEEPRPARRYRFDRPAASNGTTPSQPLSAAPRAEENKESAGRPSSSPARLSTSPADSEQSSETPAKATPSVSAQNEQQTGKQQAQAQTGTENTATVTQENSRRRGGNDRHKEAASTPAPEIGEPPVETTTAPEEVAPEDLPPLEYSELQKTTSRRRRRHRSGSSNGTSTSTAATPATPETPVTPTPSVLPRSSGSLPSTPPAPAAGGYSIVSGYTVNQMNQGNELGGPFMGPEPSPARGSVFSRDGRPASRAETPRTPTPLYPNRPSQEGISTAAMNTLANTLVQAFQAQTDRLVAELRRTSQTPASISVTLPPFPSTERVGVFVDVANLLYSARTLRISVDFGKLLDFLRGNRRLVRAHAYCPTSPQAGDEQMFLQAVKGLGYRITTKNYKTFSSGAKKADLDLDLCMDVVRLVDGRSVDCVILVSGDSDFMPMLDYCSDHGVRVEVAAFDEAMSATLRQSCDLFINLSMLEEIRS